MSSFLKRLLTAIAFVAVMVGGVYIAPWTFVLLFGLITGLSIWEYLNLAFSEVKDNTTSRKILGLLLGIIPFVIAALCKLNWLGENVKWAYYAIFLIIPSIFLTFIYELYMASEKPFKNMGILLLGITYIGIPFALLILIAFSSNTFHPNIIFGLLLMTWANDTGAYVIGSQIGRTKLFPRISPKKTWEGSAGGMLVTFIIAYILYHLFDDLRLVDWFVLAGIVAFFGTMGDLVESMLKRSLAIKDSGNLLPGHGGMLDRFDAFIFLIPFAAVYLLWRFF